MQEIRDDLRAYILSHFLPGEGDDALADDTPLLTSGILDSIKLLQVINHVEKAYDVTFEAHEASVAYCDTIEAMADLVEEKRGG